MALFTKTVWGRTISWFLFLVLYSDKSNLRMGRFGLAHCSRYSPRQQEHESTGHVTPEVTR